ncbi:hypothetical protein KSS87_007484 [Heliosperma pusillum]|nr:hypothetical protein KSS87_007484 [Heliosperma pusillum]
MQASSFVVKGKVGFGVKDPKVNGIGGFRKSTSITCNNNLRFVSNNNNSNKGSGCKLSCGSVSMGGGLARMGFDHVLKSTSKYRSVKAQAEPEDLEDVEPVKYQGKSSVSVLPYVGVACLGAILFGYHLGVVNGALEYLSADLAIAGNAVLQGWVVSILLAGATVGSFTGGSLADKFGRTRTFQLDAIPLAIGAYLCATAQTIQTMMIGRLLCGIGIGISSALVPLYISEISPTEIRGALGSVNQLFICIGILVALVAGLPLAGNPLWWRTMFGIATVPSIFLALGMAMCPESPRWLFQQGKVAEAQKAIAALYGKERVTEVMNDLRASVQGSSEPEAGWFDLFSKRYSKVVSVGAALFLFQQMAGINAVVYYSTSVFRSAGIASDVAASALVGASNVIGTAIASSLMDKKGRKSLLITSFSGMVGFLSLPLKKMLRTEGGGTVKLVSKFSKGTVVAFGRIFVYLHNPLIEAKQEMMMTSRPLERKTSYRQWGEVIRFLIENILYPPNPNNILGIIFLKAASMLLLSLTFTWNALAPYSGTLAVLGTVLYVLSFSLGAGPVPALLLPEIFASRIRAKAVALSLGMHWASNFVIGLYFLSVVNKFGISKVYLGFASVCMLAVLYIAGNVVETKGRSLEEIERALSPAV